MRLGTASRPEIKVCQSIQKARPSQCRPTKLLPLQKLFRRHEAKLSQPRMNWHPLQVCLAGLHTAHGRAVWWAPHFRGIGAGHQQPAATFLSSENIYIYIVYMLSCSVLASLPPNAYGPRHNIPPLGYSRLLAFHIYLYSRTCSNSLQIPCKSTPLAKTTTPSCPGGGGGRGVTLEHIYIL